MSGRPQKWRRLERTRRGRWGLGPARGGRPKGRRRSGGGCGGEDAERGGKKEGQRPGNLVPGHAESGGAEEACCPVRRIAALRKSRRRQPPQRRASDAAARPTQERTGSSLDCHGDIGQGKAGRGALCAGKEEAGRKEMPEMWGE